MRFWDVSGPDVEAADALPWDAPLASVMRPFSTRALVRLAVATALLYLLAGLAVLVPAGLAPNEAAHSTAWIVFGAYGAAVGLGIFLFMLLTSPRTVRRIAPTFSIVSILQAAVVVSLGVAAAGPELGTVAGIYVEAPLFAFYVLRRRWAVVCVGVVLGGFGLVVAMQDGWAAPIGQWMIVGATVVATAFLMGVIAERADRLAESEHEARMAITEVNRELDELNHTLEDRVDEQVGEIERLGGLRRFLSPQVADAVLSGAAEEVTRPHRRRIAVFFCDLRGFTAFTHDAEPEEVIGVLDEYYGAVGGLLRRYDATVGDYAGDGIMAYFGDPVPREDSALAAVEMTREISGLMGPVVAEWQRRGYDLDYGVGLAFGYATLGVVGFDGRYDYKPVGGVVNLASRLCAKAGPGQVLLDHATYAATSDRFATERLADLELKGYGAPTKAYALTMT